MIGADTSIARIHPYPGTKQNRNSNPTHNHAFLENNFTIAAVIAAPAAVDPPSPMGDGFRFYRS